MELHSIVIVSLHTPKEKIWGELLAINPRNHGARRRPIHRSFRPPINEPDGERMGLPIFFPMNRPERISLDEPSGSIPHERALRKIGRSLTVISRNLRLSFPGCDILNHKCKAASGRYQSNHVSPARFLPLFLILMSYDKYRWALLVLVVAGLSDGIDGILARRLNQRSALGAYLDPLADKLLLSSSFIILAFKQKLAWWLTILVLSRDILILTVAAVICLFSGYRPFPLASWAN
jgi:hypothetical protein